MQLMPSPLPGRRRWVAQSNSMISDREPSSVETSGYSCRYKNPHKRWYMAWSAFVPPRRRNVAAAFSPSHRASHRV